jgi:DNA polymerase-3 subunit delta'
MAIPELQGHQSVRADLIRAHALSRLPQVLLVTGEPGVGKQRLGLWIAQLVLCSASADGHRPCGRCRPCRLVAGLSHPDLHWFVPVPRPKAGDLDRQVEEVREALIDLMAARRESAGYAPPDGMAMHGVASARLILRTAALTTVEGGRRVILIGDADRLVPQESSPEAANALLKFLEEPPPSALIVLTTTEPTRVLPTIRSRAVPVRLGRLSTAEVEAALGELVPSLSADERHQRAAAAEGSVGRALDPKGPEGRRLEAGQLLAAASQGPARFERVLRQAAWQARGDFTALLDTVAETLRDRVRHLTTADPTGAEPEALRGVRDPARLVTALERVEEARDLARGNVNPQLLLATLTGQLAEALWA